MHAPNFHQIFTVLWSAFGLYWLLAAFRIKRAKATEGPSRILHLGLLGAALWLLFSSRDDNFGPLSQYFLPQTQAVALGVLLAMLGTAIAQGEWRGLLAFCLGLLSFWIKASREEAWLTREFGTSFEAHRRHAGFFLPRW